MKCVKRSIWTCCLLLFINIYWAQYAVFACQILFHIYFMLLTKILRQYNVYKTTYSICRMTRSRGSSIIVWRPKKRVSSQSHDYFWWGRKESSLPSFVNLFPFMQHYHDRRSICFLDKAQTYLFFRNYNVTCYYFFKIPWSPLLQFKVS